MKLIWNGHSCFTLNTEQGSVVFDPYQEGSVPGLSPLHLCADLVLCSHEHRDHNAAQAVALTGHTPTFHVEAISTYHDSNQGAQRGSNIVHIISAEGMRFAHLGDLGCSLTPEQEAQLKGVNVLLIPVGGHYTIDAAQAQALILALKPRVVVPMHYRSATFGYDVIAPLDQFLALRTDVVRYPSNTLEITPNTPAQTAVLTYQP